MIPYWTMPVNTKEQREARARAKAEYLAAHPDRTPRKVKGGFAANGVFYAAKTPFEKRITQWLIQAGHAPLPPTLTVTEEGEPAFVGKSGRRYYCWPITPRSLVISLDYAIAEEERALMQRGIDPEKVIP